MCPVDQLKTYLKRTRIPDKSKEYIFKAISKGKRQCIRRSNKPISYTRIREPFTEALQGAGLTWRTYELNSLLSEGATLAANYGDDD